MGYQKKLVKQPNGKYAMQLVYDGKGQRITPAKPSTATPTGPPSPIGSVPATTPAPRPLTPATPGPNFLPGNRISAPAAPASGTYRPVTPPPLPPTPPDGGGYLRVYQQDPKTKKYTIVKKHQSRMTAAEVEKAKASGLNKPKAGTPAGISTPAPAAGSGSGYFFDSLSDTMWSYRNADGSVSQHATLPTDANSATYLDGYGELPGGMLQKDAAYYTGNTYAAKQLADTLQAPRAQLDRLRAKTDGMTLYDRALKGHTEQFNLDTDGQMASLAARGMYDSGARGITAANLAESYANNRLAASAQFGAQAEQDAQSNIDNARGSFATNMLQRLAEYLATKQAGEVEEALY